jgi:transcription initiation factor TFIIA large subunit
LDPSGSADSFADQPDAKRIKSEGATTTPNDELGSDLDDEDELEGEVDDENITDLILCQYEKISRVRTRWRGVLRAGIIHIGGSDFCFSRSNTDFDW